MSLGGIWPKLFILMTTRPIWFLFGVSSIIAKYSNGYGFSLVCVLTIAKGADMVSLWCELNNRQIPKRIWLLFSMSSDNSKRCWYGFSLVWVLVYFILSTSTCRISLCVWVLSVLGTQTDMVSLRCAFYKYTVLTLIGFLFGMGPANIEHSHYYYSLWYEF